jgi:hypothetical protein
MKANKIIIAITEGRGFLFYDPIYVLLFVVIIYGLPGIYQLMIDESSWAFGFSS